MLTCPCRPHVVTELNPPHRRSGHPGRRCCICANLRCGSHHRVGPPISIGPPGGDLDLFGRCFDHAPGAWEEFLQRNGRLIYSTIHRVRLPAVDHEDTFRSLVVAMYRQLSRLRDREKLVACSCADHGVTARARASDGQPDHQPGGGRSRLPAPPRPPLGAPLALHPRQGSSGRHHAHPR